LCLFYNEKLDYAMKKEWDAYFDRELKPAIVENLTVIARCLL